ncbi:heme biosynthesis protein HemY [Aestuariispira insulae]|uniref:HemY protein n=1 Tax=Aestuariispira insulae TaxID=1461337 RepID=A0A3D9HF50_9PROT|nr:heme biosynthesis HemY N-terminal domain-containing protein [Aestuariispira insulae]RED48104.1 HemY protein [Aestuariispira insulae]
MIRGLLFLLKIAVLGAITFWLASQPGQVTVTWQDWRLDTSVGVMLILLLGVSLLLMISYNFWRSAKSAPGKFKQNRALSRRERGYKALTQGLVAVAAGDRLEARKQSRKANALLDDPPLTMLLSAQSAQLNGDDQAAANYFNAMLDHPDAAFLGVRGLMMQAAKTGNQEEALMLARKAYNLRPDTPWVLKELVDLQIKSADWAGAIRTIDEAIKAKAISQEDGKERKAQLLMEQCRAARDEGDSALALRLATQANKLSPDLTVAITTQARLLARSGKVKKAEKAIEEAWKRNPNPLLAKTYRDIAADQDPLKQVKRFEHLLSLKPGSSEGHIALARVALDAGLWGEARNHLNQLPDSEISPRVCHLMAELEEREHGDMKEARKWLNRAVYAGENGETAAP